VEHARPTTTAPDSIEPMLTLKEAQKITNLSKVTLWQATRRGDLRVMRYGRAVRIRPQDLRNFIERHMDGNAA
jgi:excisionase family DNA binding protein